MVVIIEKLNDNIHVLQQIAKKSFFETFVEVNSEADMETYLNNNLSLSQLTKEVDNPQSLFFMAKIKEDYVGYLKVNIGNAQNEFQNENALEIERIYVLKEFHRQKVGQALYAHALSIAKDKKVDYLWLGVWEYNHKAIAFYKKNGFIPFDKHEFKLGQDIQTDILMKYILK